MELEDIEEDEQEKRSDAVENVVIATTHGSITKTRPRSSSISGTKSPEKITDIGPGNVLGREDLESMKLDIDKKLLNKTNPTFLDFKPVHTEL